MILSVERNFRNACNYDKRLFKRIYFLLAYNLLLIQDQQILFVAK